MSISRLIAAIASIAVVALAGYLVLKAMNSVESQIDSLEPPALDCEPGFVNGSDGLCYPDPNATTAPDPELELSVEQMPESADPSVSIGEIDENGLSNIQTDNSLILVEVNRQDNYTNEDEPSYDYVADIIGLDALDPETCQFIFNGDVIEEKGCEWLIGFGGQLEMDESGDYALSSGGKTYASWTFTRPTDTPPLKGPAECVIEDAKVAKSTPEAVKLKLTTNDKCEEGSWYYAYETDSGSRGFNSSAELTSKGLLVVELEKDKRPANVTVAFSPDDFLRETWFETRVP